MARGDADAPQKAALMRQLWEDVQLPPCLVEEVRRIHGPRAGGDQHLQSCRVRGLGSRILGIDVRARHGRFLRTAPG